MARKQELVSPVAPAAGEPVKRGRGRPRKNPPAGATAAEAAAEPAAAPGNPTPAPPDPATASPSPDPRPPVVTTKSEPVKDVKKKPTGPAKPAAVVRRMPLRRRG